MVLTYNGEGTRIIACLIWLFLCSLSFSRPHFSIFSKLNRKNTKHVFDTVSNEKQRIAVVTGNSRYNTLIVTIVPAVCSYLCVFTSTQVQLEILQEPPQQLGHLKSLLRGGLPPVTDKAPITKRRLLFYTQTGRELSQRILKEPKFFLLQRFNSE